MFWYQIWEAWLVSCTGQALAFNRRSLARSDAQWLELKRKTR